MIERVDAEDFRWDEFFWVTEAGLSDTRLTSGAASVTFAPEGREEGALRSNEVALVEVALEALDDTVRSALDAVYDEYPRIRLDYADFADPDAVPVLANVGDLYELVDLIGVYVHQISRDGRPYVGLEFSCPWDPEHGLGVLVNGSRVVEVGGGDTAILLWIAERDRGPAQPGTS